MKTIPTRRSAKARENIILFKRWKGIVVSAKGLQLHDLNTFLDQLLIQVFLSFIRDEVNATDTVAFTARR